MPTQKNKKDSGEHGARKKAMDLLLRMDRTEKNLRDKLREKEYTTQQIDDAVSYVKSYHYLDDERFVSNYIRFHENEKSRARLRMDLIRKGADRDLIDRLLSELYDGDEEEQIRRILEKKHYDPGMDDREKRRIYALLLRKGFPVSKIIRSMRIDNTV